jgi:hypothetical protein
MQTSRPGGRLPTPTSEPPRELTAGFYSGSYSRPSPGLLIRNRDGLKILLRERPEAEVTPRKPRFYLVEPDGPFVSSLYTDNGHREFEHDNIRYRLNTSGDGSAFLLVALRRVSRRSGDEGPQRRRSAPLQKSRSAT